MENVGRSKIFFNSGKFRVNANGNRIDIWLIYWCKKCKHSWNLSIDLFESYKLIFAYYSRILDSITKIVLYWRLVLLASFLWKWKEPVRESLNFTHWLNLFQILWTTLSVLSPFLGCDATGGHAFLADSWNKAFSPFR